MCKSEGMNIIELRQWHQTELDRLQRASKSSFDIDAQRANDAREAVHWDAIQLLKWCVEVPVPEPGGHEATRAFAFEILAEHTANIAETFRLAVVADECPELAAEDAAADKVIGEFFIRLSDNCAEQLPGG